MVRSSGLASGVYSSQIWLLHCVNAMAAIRSAIQKEVFNQVDERLVGIVNVTKLGRKKKTSFLCLSGGCAHVICVYQSVASTPAPPSPVNVQESPPQVFISRVKSSEKKASDKSERETYRKAKGQSWLLSELRLVDGKSADSEVAEFDLHFDKTTFKWVASSVAEKKAFVTCLYKVGLIMPPGHLCHMISRCYLPTAGSQVFGQKEACVYECRRREVTGYVRPFWCALVDV